MKQGEVWLISLDPTIGSEIKKTRPAIIINDYALGKLPLRIIVPLTDWKAHYNTAIWMVNIKPDPNNNLSKSSAADCFQIRSVSEQRFVKRLGRTNSLHLNEIQLAVASVISLS
ncbi:type II toxin-antitoxin system PemK/MazF family toxin [Mucilaginibacter terrae]|uniref:type II toxin-antitoxin system PemK/MazF family toxin n=1 Tax=Mucilaginibacter terrae TaxID=1955052 RepID=UPI00363918E0